MTKPGPASRNSLPSPDLAHCPEPQPMDARPRLQPPAPPDLAQLLQGSQVTSPAPSNSGTAGNWIPVLWGSAGKGYLQLLFLEAHWLLSRRPSPGASRANTPTSFPGEGSHWPMKLCRADLTWAPAGPQACPGPEAIRSLAACPGEVLPQPRAQGIPFSLEVETKVQRYRVINRIHAVQVD